MSLTNLDKDELNQLVFNLKEYEIEQCRIKLIELTKGLKEQPNQKIITMRLKLILERLEHLQSS